MNPTLNILGISGSLRTQSRNTGLLRFAKQCLPAVVNFQIADLTDIPFYNADRCDPQPEPVQTYHLRQVCVYLNLRPVNKPEVFSNAFSAAFNESGDLIDPSLQQQVTALMNALLAWYSQLAK